jgi:acetyl esterase
VETVTADFARYPDAERLPYPELRRVLESVRARWTQGGPSMAASEEVHAPTRHGPVRVRIYRPDPGARRPVLVYLHGGGWTFFSLDTHDRLMREYAARAGIVVAGVDYALSPEAKFPVALGQTTDVLSWLGETGDRLGIDTTGIAVGGDSAGANLSVAACLTLRDSGLDSLVRGMVLNYGAFDAQCEGAALSPYGGAGYMLGYEEMQTYWRNYVRSDDDFSLPLVSPLRAELAGLPPALLVIPECDVLSAQSHALAAKLRRARVQVCARVYKGATHSFLEAVSIAAVSELALSDTADWLRKLLAEDRRAAR